MGLQLGLDENFKIGIYRGVFFQFEQDMNQVDNIYRKFSFWLEDSNLLLL